MRSVFVSLALGAAALGVLAVGAGEAKAQWPVVATGYRFGGYGTMNLYGVPLVRWYNTPWGGGQFVYSPGAYHTAVTPYGTTQLWYGPSATNITYSPWWGYSVQSSSPAVTGFTFSPYGGLRPLGLPSFNYSSGVNLNNPAGFTTIGASGQGLIGNTFSLNSGLGLPTVQPMVAFATVSLPNGGIAVIPVSGRRSEATSIGNTTTVNSGLRGPSAYNNYIPPNLIIK